MGLTRQCPINGRRYKVEGSGLFSQKKDFTHLDEKNAILSSSSLTYPIRGTAVLTDITSGKIVDRVDNFNFGDMFYITPKHTVIYSGNNYIASNLLVRLPGVFVRHTNTGDLEAEFNTGRGQSFSILLYPKEQLFKLHVDGSEVPVAVLISTVLQVAPASVERYIPLEIWQKNLAAIQGKEAKYVSTLYGKFVAPYLQDKKDSFEAKITKLREAVMKGELSKDRKSVV